MSDIKICGAVESVVFNAPDTGFSILRVLDDVLGKINVTGNFPPVTKGCIVEGLGSKKKHPKYGEQISMVAPRVRQPVSTEGIFTYLQSDIFSGIGPKTAKLLVDAFGTETLKVLRTSQERVARVEGIGSKRAQIICEQAQSGVHIEAIMTWLYDNGCGSANAVKIHKAYGSESIKILTANPWVLADEIHGIGFDTADKIAQKLGLGGANPDRVSAGISYTLKEVEKNGHTAVSLEGLTTAVGKLLAIDAGNPQISASLDHLVEKNRASVVTKLDQTIWVQSRLMHVMESKLADALLRLDASNHMPWKMEAAVSLISKIAAAQKFDPSPDQYQALKTIVSSRITLLIGGPGSGKTTTTNIAVKSLLAANQRLRVMGCAPTGKAASRISEQTGLAAVTVHRLIGWGSGGQPQYNRNNPLPVDFLLVDETSMLDTVTAARLLEALPAHACILLVGDTDQLPSVGSGSILADFIRSGLIKVARLTTIHRQAAGSSIIQNAYAVRDGRIKDIAAGNDFGIIECENSSLLANEISAIIKDDCAALGFAPNQIQVITGGHRAETGTKDLNNRLQKILNPDGERFAKLKFGDTTFLVGDKVIITKNNYDLGLFNGQMGFIDAIYDDGTVTATIEGDQVRLNRQDMAIVALAYALTVHKCQGSEFPCVILIVDTAHFTLLDRHWLYTGLTRAKKYCFIAAVPRAVGIAVRNVAPRKRNTLLVDKLAT